MEDLYIKFDTKVHNYGLAKLIDTALRDKSPRTYLKTATTAFMEIRWLREASITRHVLNLYSLREIELIMSLRNRLLSQI